MLYEIRKDIMPFDYLSDLELELWGMYYQEKEAAKDG